MGPWVLGSLLALGLACVVLGASMIVAGRGLRSRHRDG